MKLHSSVTEKLIHYFENYGGHSTHDKLRKLINSMDLTPYEKKTGSQEVVLVLTEDFMKQVAGGK
jgi:hypothetical protein